VVELLMVVVIIGLVAGFSMPRIGQVVARDRVRRAQFAVGSYVELAFQYAARVRKPMTITLNSGTKIFAITNRADGTLYRQYDLSQTGVWGLTNATISPSAGITIFPTGLSSAALTITLTNNSYSKTVTSTIAGQVTKP
jgi:type II secretory pathway pseudopilin PulG